MPKKTITLPIAFVLEFDAKVTYNFPKSYSKTSITFADDEAKEYHESQATKSIRIQLHKQISDILNQHLPQNLKAKLIRVSG